MAELTTHPDDTALAAVLDQSIAPPAEVRSHLESCDQCQAALDDMHLLRTALQASAAVRAPRSFAVTAPPAKAPARPLRGWSSSLLWGRLTATLAGTALVVLIGVDLGWRGAAPGGSPIAVSQSMAAQRATEQALDAGARPAQGDKVTPEKPAPAAAPAQATAAPPEPTAGVPQPPAQLDPSPGAGGVPLIRLLQMAAAAILGVSVLVIARERFRGRGRP